MSKPFDSTLQQLTDAFANDWVAFLCDQLGLPVGPAEPLESDLSATMQGNKLFRLHPPGHGIIHVEFQASWEEGLPFKVLKYNVMADDRYGEPVYSSVLLLRPEANSSELTGHLVRSKLGEHNGIEFRYGVIRLWELPLESLLKSSLGLLPLAPLTREAKKIVPSVLKQIEDRFAVEKTDPSTANHIRAATYFLLGLQFKRDEILRFYSEISGMEESTTFQYVKELGLLQGRREDILRLGTKRFGNESDGAKAQLESIQDPERLGRILDRIFEAPTWDNLLATP